MAKHKQMSQPALTYKLFRKEMANVALRSEVNQRFEQVDKRFDKLESEIVGLRQDLVQHVRAIMEHTTQLIGVIDEKYKDIPDRVIALEETTGLR